jgi:signal transduction histidine kinase
MCPDDKEPRSEREQTNQSLRVEREQADRSREAEVAAIDEAADAVISLARARADAVLAAARAKTDAQSPTIAGNERVLEDQVLHDERAAADKALRGKRAEHVVHHSRQREETDKDLSSERARSDHALATRDEFLGIVSHDLRNMLNAVVGYASLIETDVSQANHEEQVRSHAQRIRRSGARMSRLIGDLVDIASIEAGRLAVTREVGDPTHVVTEAVETFQAQASARGVSLVAEIVPPPLVAFDPARILQVLTNLLSNAIKFTPPHGKVIVRVEHVEELRFAVSDTGLGIPRDQLEAVFERFLQVTKSDRRGVGLGLYISKAIVQGHGGRIWAESTIGDGSTFYFTLPVAVGP